jgi:hypothetical protein
MRQARSIVTRAQDELLRLLSDRVARGLDARIEQIDCDAEGGTFFAHVYFPEQCEEDYVVITVNTGTPFDAHFDHRRYSRLIAAAAPGALLPAPRPSA